jgi:hypothetical protein
MATPIACGCCWSVARQPAYQMRTAACPCTTRRQAGERWASLGGGLMGVYMCDRSKSGIGAGQSFWERMQTAKGLLGTCRTMVA